MAASLNGNTEIALLLLLLALLLVMMETKRGGLVGGDRDRLALHDTTVIRDESHWKGMIRCKIARLMLPLRLAAIGKLVCSVFQPSTAT